MNVVSLKCFFVIKVINVDRISIGRLLIRVFGWPWKPAVCRSGVITFILLDIKKPQKYNGIAGMTGLWYLPNGPKWWKSCLQGVPKYKIQLIEVGDFFTPLGRHMTTKLQTVCSKGRQKIDLNQKSADAI